MPFTETSHPLTSRVTFPFILCTLPGKVGMGRNRIFTRNDNHQIVVSEGKAAAGNMKMFRGSTTGISLHSINDFIGTVPPLSVLIWLAFTTCQTFIPFRDGLSLETM